MHVSVSGFRRLADTTGVLRRILRPGYRSLPVRLSRRCDVLGIIDLDFEPVRDYQYNALREYSAIPPKIRPNAESTYGMGIL